MIKKLLLAGVALTFCGNLAYAKDLKLIGISGASMGNPFFVALAKGATFEAKKINPAVQVTTVAYDYDLGRQFTEIDNFIAAGVDMILLSAGDPKAIKTAIKKAEAAGITVVAVDARAEGADVTVTTDNVQAGEVSCQYLVDRMGHKGNVIIESGPSVSVVFDRVKGCESVLAKYPDIKILSSGENGNGSRDVGFSVAQSLLTRFPQVDGLFAINDPEAIGAALAAKQLGRTNFPITGIDGSPDMENALEDPAMAQIVGTATQDPFLMARIAVHLGDEMMNGHKVDKPLTLLPSVLVTRDTVKTYKGWNSPSH
ncbi:ABC transporter substrate-binding protein [Acidisoma cladoniae]|jgi:ribose transport system substrate-binding protein|uniref:ABC transporter substrate-binding protein n=1 Tax=Acidisoma cladoniae TaxID=3040935 RepID=UPI00254E91D9|nr:ABC transporter substrate-binding protein [Acidisoma sp. PAMC 29798]